MNKKSLNKNNKIYHQYKITQILILMIVSFLKVIRKQRNIYYQYFVRMINC